MTDLAALSLDQIADMVVRWGAAGFWALIILVVGWIAAGWAERAVDGGLTRLRMVDAMLRHFFASLARWTLLAFTGIAVLEKLGVQTTSLIAVLGAAGLAIGLALQGTLANLAAGVMLLLFRPFRVGDSIEAGALAGTVAQVALFHTSLITGENIRVVVPNATLSNVAIRNLSHFPTRKAEIVVPLPYGIEFDATMARIRALAQADSRVAAEPAPGIAIAKLGDKTMDLSVTVWCAGSVVGAVKSDLMAAIIRECKVGAP